MNAAWSAIRTPTAWRRLFILRAGGQVGSEKALGIPACEGEKEVLNRPPGEAVEHRFLEPRSQQVVSELAQPFCHEDHRVPGWPAAIAIERRTGLIEHAGRQRCTTLGLPLEELHFSLRVTANADDVVAAKRHVAPVLPAQAANGHVEVQSVLCDLGGQHLAKVTGARSLRRGAVLSENPGCLGRP